MFLEMLQVSWNATSQLTQKKFKKEMTFYVSLEWSYSILRSSVLLILDQIRNEESTSFIQ